MSYVTMFEIISVLEELINSKYSTTKESLKYISDQYMRAHIAVVEPTRTRTYGAVFIIIRIILISYLNKTVLLNEQLCK